jgi:hypothetical protein
MKKLDRVVKVIHDGHTVIFRTDEDPPVAFWSAHVGGKVYPLPLRVMGGEGPEFFLATLRQLLLRNEF